MHNDQTVWECLNRECCFRRTCVDQRLCANIYNATGSCTKLDCPLANGYYGTVMEERGRCFLYLKTIERAHLPRKLWQKIALPDEPDKAIGMIERLMVNIYSDYQVTNVKARFLKLQEVLQRIANIAERNEFELTGHENRKTEKREEVREAAALRAAHIQTTVEKELIRRLKEGHYGDLYPIPVDEPEPEDEKQDSTNEHQDEDAVWDDAGEGEDGEDEDDEDDEDFPENYRRHDNDEEMEEEFFDEDDDEETATKLRHHVARNAEMDIEDLEVNYAGSNRGRTR